MRTTRRIKRWTPQEDEQLRSMFVAGRRPTEIAAKLQRTTCVYQKLELGRSGDEGRPGWRVT
jgi:hypothetical protein